MTRIDEKAPAESIDEFAGVSLPVAREQEEKWGWKREHRIGIAVMLGVMLVVMTLWYLRRPADRAGPVIVGGRPLSLPVNMDPNTADEGALSRIPGIGPKTAGEIVKYRDTHRHESPDGIVFRTMDELIEKVGPRNKKAQQQARVYLIFVDEPEVSPRGLKTMERVGEAEDIEE